MGSIPSVADTIALRDARWPPRTGVRAGTEMIASTGMTGTPTLADALALQTIVYQLSSLQAPFHVKQ